MTNMSYEELVAAEMEAIEAEVKATGVNAYKPVSSSHAYQAGATTGEMARVHALLELEKKGVIVFYYYGKY